MDHTFRFRIQAAGQFSPPVTQLTEEERVLVFRAVQSVISADGFLAQPGADLLLNLRSELNLDFSGFNEDLERAFRPGELRKFNVRPPVADYICYMALLAGYADGRLTESEAQVVDQICAALSVPDEHRVEIQGACLRAILEANILMNLPEVIATSDLARRFADELNLSAEIIEQVADAIMVSLSEG